MSAGLRTAYRLTVEGWGVEAVTDRDMEDGTPADGVTRHVGLHRSGLSIEESVDLARAEAEGSSFTATITDEQWTDLWTLHCAHQPQVRTWLTGDINATSDPVNIAVDNAAGFIVGDYIHIGTECMKVTAKPLSEGGPVIQLTVSRARRGTIKQAHYTDDGEELTRPVVTHTYPMSLEGRRARLYEYRLDEHALDGEGELLWRGILSTDASMNEDGTEWSFTVDSLYRLLDQDVGGDTEGAFSLRGYYYSGIKPLDISIARRTGSAAINAEEARWFVSGHFPTTADLVAEINASRPASVDTWTDAHVAGTCRATEVGDGWGIVFRTNGTETEHLFFIVHEHSNPAGQNTARAPDYPPSSYVAATYLAEFEDGPMIAPRGVWGPHRGGVLVEVDDDNHPYTIYPDSLVLLNEGDSLVLEDAEGEAQIYGVTTEDDTNRRYLLNGRVRDEPFFTPETAPRFKRMATYAIGNLEDFRAALVAMSPADANRGAAPFVTSEDTGSWVANVERGAAIAGPLARRRFVVAQAVNLKELIAADCMILGTFPRLQSDAKIGMGYLELPSTSTPIVFSLDDSNILVDEQPPSWERNAIYGSINTVNFLTGYDPAEDEHMGPTYRVRDVTSLSIDKSSKGLSVEPGSSDNAPFTARNVVDAFRRVLGVFGRPYSVVTVQVPYTLRPLAYIGVVCDITSARLPNVVTGGRGVTSVKGLVISRQWDLDTSRGTLQVLVSDSQLVGYTPSLSIDSNTPKGGDEYAFTIGVDDPDGIADMVPSGYSLPGLFPVGTRVELMEWDSSTQTPQVGTVTVVSSTQVQIMFDSSPTLTGTRYLRYAAADEITVDGVQTDWAYMANASSIVEFGSGDETAREFSA